MGVVDWYFFFYFFRLEMAPLGGGGLYQQPRNNEKAWSRRVRLFVCKAEGPGVAGLADLDFFAFLYIYLRFVVLSLVSRLAVPAPDAVSPWRKRRGDVWRADWCEG